MPATLRLPEWLQRELDSPAPVGQRHEQIKRLLRGLVWLGSAPGDCFNIIRARYASDVPDREIENLIRWSFAKITPRRPGAPSTARAPWSPPDSSPPVPTLPPAVLIRQFVGDFRIGEADLFDVSPIPLSEKYQDDARLFLETLFEPEDRVNLVWEYAREGDKARPAGKGITLSRREMILEMRGNAVFHGEAGAWVRINPLDGKGVSDGNVTRFRFALLECDDVPLELQATFFAKLPLPIVALISSGGRSLHAWVRINAPDPDYYREIVRAIFSRLVRFGVDPANKNPSRLARLPGVPRGIGGAGDSLQRLLYLNPAAFTCEPILR